MDLKDFYLKILVIASISIFLIPIALGCRNVKKDNKEYLKTIEPLLEQTEKEMKEARNIMKSRMFTMDIHYSYMYGSDISDAKSTLESAEKILKKNQKRFKKEDAPKEAREIKEKIETYFKYSDRYLSNIEKIIEYIEKTTPIIEEYGEEYIDAEFKAMEAFTMEEEAKVYKEQVKLTNQFIDQFKKIEPPKSLQNIHNHYIQNEEEQLIIIKKLIDAASKGDENEYEKLYLQIGDPVMNYERITREDNKILLEKSNEAKMVKKIKELYIEIEDDIQDLKKELKI